MPITNKLIGGRAIPNELIYGGLRLQPWFRYRAEDVASGSTWAPVYGGGALTVGAAPPTFGALDYPFNARDTSLVFPDSSVGYYYAANNTVNDLGTEDTCWLAVVKNSGASDTRTILSKAELNGSFRGYIWRLQSGNLVNFNFTNSAGVGSSITSASVASLGAWLMIHVFIDTSEASTNGSQIYVNGEASGSGADLSTAGSMTNTRVFHISREVDSHYIGTGFDSHFCMVAAWKQGFLWPGGTSNATVWREIARTHFLQWNYGI